MKVQTVGAKPTTIEVEDNGDGTYTAADGTTYKAEHTSSIFVFVSKVESVIDAVEETIAGELPVEEVSEEQATEEEASDEGSAIDGTSEDGEQNGVEPAHEGGTADGPPSPEPEAV